MTILTKEDKIQLINSHKRSLEYSRYGLTLDVLKENAKSTPDQEEISRLESIIDETDNQIAALDVELATVNALAE